jgi:phosphatidylethanolamine/phosphatidyl-N-methylethanolamine N-methyltransferase
MVIMKNSDRTRRIFWWLSHVYDRVTINRWFERPRRREFELANIQATDRVLLVGIGTGLDLPYLPQDATVVGIDLSPAMLARARAKITSPATSIAIMDAEHLGFADATFDVILMNLVLSIVDDPQRALHETSRVLKPARNIWLLHKNTKPSQVGMLRRALNWITTTISGADITRSVNHLIMSLPLDKRLEERTPLADIICLTRST